MIDYAQSRGQPGQPQLDSRDERIAELEAQLAQAQAVIAALEAQNTQSQQQITELREQVAQLQQRIAELIAVKAARQRVEEELRQSYVKLQRALEGIVHVLVSTVEMGDSYTAGHQRRVTQLACAIANEMGLPKGRIEGIRMAGLIHDIGKIDVPAEILSKPGPLDAFQFDLIKTHPQVGYNMLDGTIDFPWPVAEIVLQHHERMDGSGYPQGLSGEEILLEARILAVADVVEAMSSHRPYRPTLGVHEALVEILQNRGIFYDPEVVDACVKLFKEKRFKFE